MKNVYILAIVVVALVGIGSIATVLMPGDSPSDDTTMPPAEEEKYQEFTEVAAYSDEITFLVWGIADYYDDLYVKVVLEGESELTQKIMKDGSMVEQTVVVTGEATMKSLIGRTIDTRPFTATETLIDEGFDAVQTIPESIWYSIDWENEEAISNVESYEYIFAIEDLYEYKYVVSDGVILTDAYEVAEEPGLFSGLRDRMGGLFGGDEGEEETVESESTGLIDRVRGMFDFNLLNRE